MKKVFIVFATILLISCLSFTTAATTLFKPSVEAKDAPEIVPHNGVFAEVIDKNGNVITKITDGGQIKITPLSQSTNADPDIGESLKRAYQTLKDARSLLDIVANLSSILKELHPGFSANNLVAKDLFNLSLGGVGPISEDNQIKITFKIATLIPPIRTTGMPVMKNLMITQNPYASVKNLANSEDPRSDILIVALCKGDKDWPVIKPENVVNNGDGTVTITFSELGTVLFIVEGDAASTVPGMSAGNDYTLIAAIVGVSMAVIITSIVIFNRKKVTGKAK